MNLLIRFFTRIARTTLWLVFFACVTTVARSETWQEALAKMPLTSQPSEINRTNFADLMLTSFGSNQTVKAIVLMPGATDEYYFFHRGLTRLTNHEATLLDAVIALTNQTCIRATFLAPLLLLHTDEDPEKPAVRIDSKSMAEVLKEKPFVPHIIYNDRDWDYLIPIITETLDVKLYPKLLTRDSWHFYRHSLAGWNLTGWEALEAISLAGKTSFAVQHAMLAKKPQLVFEPYRRPGVPKPR